MPNSAASRLVLADFSEETVAGAAKEVLAEIGGRVTCALVFVSAGYRDQIEDFLELIQLHGHVPLIAGCSGAGLIGTGKEAEQLPGFSILFLHLPETEVTAYTFSQREIEESSGPEFWHAELGRNPEAVDSFVVLANPAALAVDQWLQEWNTAWPGVPCVGGLASGGSPGEEMFVFKDRALVEAGAVVLGFKGGLIIHTIVSQGCRPIGEPLTVTQADRNVVESLGSRPAYQVLLEAVQSLPEEERARVQGNLFAGLATSEYIDEFKTGDFLIRNILGANAETGTLAIGAYPRVGQTLQFQLRDRQSADEELRELLSRAWCQGVRPFCSLLFSCNGRGTSLFGAPDHDAGAVTMAFHGLPTAGFFCNGEIGPVGQTNFLHGYTASVALLCDPVK